MKILLVKRKRFTILAGILVALGMFYAVNYPAVAGVSGAARQLPIYSVQRDQKVVSLTFDAAWGNEDTQALIDILKKYNVRATFFVVGDWAERYPESVKALHDAGHEVMNHSDTHAHMTKLSRDQILADVEACNDTVEKVTGVRPTLFRPPYGEYDDKVIAAIRSLGMEPIQWDVDSLDWKELSAEEITRRVTSKVQPGSIILFHNAALHTPEALPGIIEKLIQEGYQIIPVSELIIHGNYTIDHTGRQIAVQPMVTEPAPQS